MQGYILVNFTSKSNLSVWECMIFNISKKT